MKRILLLITMVAAIALASWAQGKTLVAYFSATGNTERVARQIAAATGGDLLEIVPAQKYTSADLNWRDSNSRSSVEMNDEGARPAIDVELAAATDYGLVFVGYPIWWDLAPRVVNTFLESYDFAGKTVIPFATSGGSTIDNSERELKKAYPNLNWEKGRLLNRTSAEEIGNWAKSF